MTEDYYGHEEDYEYGEPWEHRNSESYQGPWEEVELLEEQSEAYYQPEGHYPDLAPEEMEYETVIRGWYRPYVNPENAGLARRYDKYGHWLGIFAIFLPFLLGPLALYYGKKAQKLDQRKGDDGIFLGSVLTFMSVFYVVPLLFAILFSL